ncbi:MAG: hypothetical protein Q6373_017510 [Candidatus Sigynarchaeota archaeon]
MPFIKSFLNIINKNAFFYFCLVFHIFVYWAGALIAYFILGWSVFSDFNQSGIPTIAQFLVDPAEIYRINSGTPYRSLPSLMLYASLFGMYGSPEVSYISFSLSFSIWNVGASVLLSKTLSRLNENKMKQNGSKLNPLTFASFYLLLPWQWMAYLMSNADVACGFFILLGIYLYINKRDNLAFFSWSSAINFKPLAIYFLILVFYDSSVKKLIKRASFIIFAQIPNIILFLIYPNLLPDFISLNINASLSIIPFKNISSGSFSRNIAMLFSLPLIPTVIIIAVLMIPFQFFYVLKEHGMKMTLIDRMYFIFLTCIAIVPDFYTLHIFLLVGIYLLWLSTGNLSDKNRVKYLPIVPTFFITPWLFFPYLSIFYFIPLLYMDYLLLKKPVSRTNACF